MLALRAVVLSLVPELAAAELFEASLCMHILKPRARPSASGTLPIGFTNL